MDSEQQVLPAEHDAITFSDNDSTMGDNEVLVTFFKKKIFCTFQRLRFQCRDDTCPYGLLRLPLSTWTNISTSIWYAYLYSSA